MYCLLLLYRCRFVRLYYVDDLTCTDEELTITLAFPFDAELVLKFPGGCLAGLGKEALSWRRWWQPLVAAIFGLVCQAVHAGVAASFHPPSTACVQMRRPTMPGGVAWRTCC